MSLDLNFLPYVSWKLTETYGENSLALDETVRVNRQWVLIQARKFGGMLCSKWLCRSSFICECLSEFCDPRGC